jgi:hypothetical protein
MRRLAFVVLLAAVLAPAALAKGPSAASVTGPGLGKAVSVKGTEESGALGALTQYSGFFPAAFGQQPDPMLHGRPAGKLGPQFTIRYLVPGPNGDRFRIRQDLYLYAKGGAVTYMKPGQRIFDMRTRGGWYRGGPELKRTLVGAGLPRTAPRSDSGSGHLAVLLGIGAPGAALLAGAAVFVARRRRSA